VKYEDIYFHTREIAGNLNRPVIDYRRLYCAGEKQI
jgi:hypothetical protein